MPEICPRHARDMPKICPRYTQTQVMPKICPRYDWYLLNILDRSHWWSKYMLPLHPWSMILYQKINVARCRHGYVWGEITIVTLRKIGWLDCCLKSFLVTVQTRMIKSAIYPPCLCRIGPDMKRWVLRRWSESSCKLGGVTAGQISATCAHICVLSTLW